MLSKPPFGSYRHVLIRSKFRPAWWLRNPHAQTIWAAKISRRPSVETNRERLDTPDGDFLDLDWTRDCEGPLVAVFHGLGGSIHSRYASAVLKMLADNGMQGVLMHFRGCSEEPNRKVQTYHSGHTVDIDLVIRTLRERFATRPLAAIGYSLGGNALLNYLARDNPLDFAISVSPPLVLAEGATRLEKGFSRIYQRTLLEELKRGILRKLAMRPELSKHYPADLDTLNTFRLFDDKLTAPLHGFEGVDDYYARASARQYLKDIRTRTHVLFARDDPFFTENCIPQSSELSDQVTFELSERGGHVGFVSGHWPLLGQDWMTRHLHQLLANAFGSNQPGAAVS
jgi:predicted alpha/beta-fold hydrolase